MTLPCHPVGRRKRRRTSVGKNQQRCVPRRMDVKNIAEAADLEHFGNLWIKRTERHFAPGRFHLLRGKEDDPHTRRC